MRVKSAWVNLRRGRYFVGSYSETPELTIIGPAPYYVLTQNSPAHVGQTAHAALAASKFENVSWDEAQKLAEQRVLELAHLAGVKARTTFERGARLVDLDHDNAGEILVTPNHRKRGYWDPMPERYWLRVRRPSDAELGKAIIAALDRATA